MDNIERYISYYEGEKDVTVIEVLEKDKISDNKYLLVDLNYKHIYQNGKYLLVGYPRDSIYGNERHISSEEKKNRWFWIWTFFAYWKGSSGAPICLFDNIKVIGINKAGHKINLINFSTFIRTIIDELENEYKEIKSEIKSEIKVKKMMHWKIYVIIFVKK